MQDLNDFYFFHAVVTHQGFSAAARAIGVPKGTLSKAVTRLEDRLHVRLLERTTRKLRMTDVGRAFYEQCQVILAGVEAAEAAAAEAYAEPNGLVRMSCPQGLIQHLIADVLPGFMKVYPKVRVQLKVINRPADLVDDGIDVALRARSGADQDSSLIVRPLGRSRLVLAMSPALRDSRGEMLSLDRLAEASTLSMAETGDDDTWQLVGPRGESRVIHHRPRLLCSNFDMLHAAALEGVGIALLPDHITRASFDSGELIHVLPEWGSPFGVVQAVFSTRKGLLPAVRALIDYLAVTVPRKLSLNSTAVSDSAGVGQ
ncbi:LysR family transcriptional regulator [Brucellaceae bacterium VT-16-1752]|nr:LysR family transcriptional regulator [Brucellaceae bacterium VT-16-1752]